MSLFWNDAPRLERENAALREALDALCTAAEKVAQGMHDDESPSKMKVFISDLETLIGAATAARQTLQGESRDA